LFGAYWDDETTQAEREWVETHFSTCPRCRGEYEEFARALELVSALPRVETAPDLADRVLARARRTASIPDRLPAAPVRWVPVTAAAAALTLVVTLVVPWVATSLRPRTAPAPTTPAAVALGTSSGPVAPAPAIPAPDVARTPGPGAGPAELPAEALAVAPDSLFDHSEDVEFILDPVTLRRGRAAVARMPAGVQGERAVISF
jgi:hypothetical protein